MVKYTITEQSLILEIDFEEINEYNFREDFKELNIDTKNTLITYREDDANLAYIDLLKLENKIKNVKKCKHCKSSDIAIIQTENNAFNFYCFTCGMNYEFTQEDK